MRLAFRSLFLFLVAAASTADAQSLDAVTDAAESVARSVSGAGRAVGGFFGRVGDALFGGREGEVHLEAAIESYVSGAPFTTTVAARRLLLEGDPVFRDEAGLLAGIAAAELGRPSAAAERLDPVLDQEPASAYYPLAMAAIVEAHVRAGDVEGAADVAGRRFASWWEKPPNGRMASIKGIFLEQGALTAIELPQVVTVADIGADPRSRPNNPIDQAVHRAGQALLSARRYREAAVCFRAIAPTSPYYPYARFALAQSLYGAGILGEARDVFGQVHAFPARVPGEVHLKDRAALALARLHAERGRAGPALGWLRAISSEGPWARHAVLLSGEIQRAQDADPSLVLAYLDESIEADEAPLIGAKAAGLQAEVALEAGWFEEAEERVAGATKSLEEHEAALREAAAARMPETLAFLHERRRALSAHDDWQRRNVANAIPALIDFVPSEGWLSRRIASWTADEGTPPVVYYQKEYNPFTTLPPPPPDSGARPEDAMGALLFRLALEVEAVRLVDLGLELDRTKRDGSSFELAMRLAWLEESFGGEISGTTGWRDAIGLTPGDDVVSRVLVGPMDSVGVRTSAATDALRTTADAWRTELRVRAEDAILAAVDGHLGESRRLRYALESLWSEALRQGRQQRLDTLRE